MSIIQQKIQQFVKQSDQKEAYQKKLSKSKLFTPKDIGKLYDAFSLHMSLNDKFQQIVDLRDFLQTCEVHQFNKENPLVHNIIEEIVENNYKKKIEFQELIQTLENYIEHLLKDEGNDMLFYGLQHPRNKKMDESSDSDSSLVRNNYLDIHDMKKNLKLFNKNMNDDEIRHMINVVGHEDQISQNDFKKFMEHQTKISQQVK